MRVVDAALHDATGLGQLSAGVHAQALLGVVGLVGEHGAARLAGDGQHIGEVELALGVVRVHLIQRLEERSGVEAVEARVALGDGGLFERSVLLLDDAGHLPGTIAHDAAVAEGVFQFHGEHHHGGIVLLAQGAHLADGLGADERRIAGEHHHGAVEAGKRVLRGQHRVGRAALGSLDGHFGIAFHQRRHLLAAMAHHGDNAVGPGRLGGFHDPAHERSAQHLVGHLRLLRLHAGAGSRRQNDRSCFHETPFYSHLRAQGRPFPIGSV